MTNRFRWVECQLRTLKRCKTAGKVEDTLLQLPETLDETYDRILNNVSKEDREQAHSVLQILAYSGRPLSASEVAAAITVDCKEERVDPKLSLLDPSDLIEICSSLIEFSEFESHSV
jgi:hypothetical protein